MKNLKLFLVMLLAIVLVLPFSVFAEDEVVDDNASEENVEVTDDGSEDTTEESNEVKVYFFRGEGCPHCADAEEWFESIEEEYGSKFEIVDYETWENADNAELMQEVAEARKEEANGVPYIIVGNHSWNGFADDYADEILEAINSEYETPVNERYDIMKLLPESNKATEEKKSKSSDVVSLFLIVIIVGAVIFGVVQARKNTY